MMHFKFLIFKS
jgi:hypothetical protein